MSEPVKCGWCGLVDPSPHSEVIHRGTLECVDTLACANRLAESEKDELRAEVKRLRGLIAQVESGPEWRGERCPWCGASVDAPTHAPDCPAFSAWGEVRR